MRIQANFWINSHKFDGKCDWRRCLHVAITLIDVTRLNSAIEKVSTSECSGEFFQQSSCFAKVVFAADLNVLNGNSHWRRHENTKQICIRHLHKWEVSHDATVDALTKLSKTLTEKKAFIQLFKSTRSSCLVRIEFLNLNRFKRVNSSWFQLKAFR